MWKTLRWVAIGVLSLPPMAIAYFAWSRPDQFSRLFLRSGGQIVKEMADHPGRVAAFLAVSVVTLWMIIAARCAWEAWREARNPPGDLPSSVANR